MLLFHSLQIAILLFVLLLWAGAISLFYHQWGKIRGIDDYQPDYVHANMTIQHNPIPEETSDKLVCNDFFHRIPIFRTYVSVYAEKN